MTRSRQTADWGSRAGLAKIVPSSVAVGSGTGSASALGTVTFSGASTVSLNSVFSSTYDNYRILVDITDCTADAEVTFRLRSGSTDASGGSYQLRGVHGAGSQIFDAQTSFRYFTELDAQASFHYYSSSVDLKYPFKVEFSGIAFQSYSVTGSTSSPYAAQMVGTHTLETSYDGFSIISSAGNMTGTILVYGYTI